MRDVTPNNNIHIQEILKYLSQFIKHPLEKIKNLPEWNWASLLALQIILALVSGVLAGLIKLNIYRVFAGLIIMPIVSTIAALLLALFLYYYFQFFENRTESYRKILTLVTLSSIPFYLFQILSEIFSPVTLIGFGFTSLLGVVGLCENFQVKRKRAYQLIGSLFILVLMTWILSIVK